jgi:hypothetical protein
MKREKVYFGVLKAQGGKSTLRNNQNLVNQ